MPAPKASDRHCGGISLPNAPITTVKEQPASPKPIITPGTEVEHRRRSGMGHRGEAQRVEDRAHAEHWRGTETIRYRAREGLGHAPQQHLDRERERKESRPQLCALDIGVTRKPIPERGPKPSGPMRHPHARMTPAKCGNRAMRATVVPSKNDCRERAARDLHHCRVTTTSRYSLGTTIVLSPERLNRLINANRSSVSAVRDKSGGGWPGDDTGSAGVDGRGVASLARPGLPQPSGVSATPVLRASRARIIPAG